jgi:hypothetical protein
MTARRRGAETKQDLSERQRYWLKHVRAAERKGEPLRVYAKRLGVSEHSLYEAKRRLRLLGVLAQAPQGVAPSTPSTGFVQVEVSDPGRAPACLRVRLGSGALLEWSEAPQGDALRELIGFVS